MLFICRHIVKVTVSGSNQTQEQLSPTITNSVNAITAYSTLLQGNALTLLLFTIITPDKVKG